VAECPSRATGSPGTGRVRSAANLGRPSIGALPAAFVASWPARATPGVLRAAAALGATQAVVGPRGDEAYPIPERLYRSLGFTTIDRTRTYSWSRRGPQGRE
jgi:hypothetical protein